MEHINTSTVLVIVVEKEKMNNKKKTKIVKAVGATTTTKKLPSSWMARVSATPTHQRRASSFVSLYGTDRWLPDSFKSNFNNTTRKRSSFSHSYISINQSYPYRMVPDIAYYPQHSIRDAHMCLLCISSHLNHNRIEIDLDKKNTTISCTVCVCVCTLSLFFLSFYSLWIVHKHYKNSYSFLIPLLFMMSYLTVSVTTLIHSIQYTTIYYLY